MKQECGHNVTKTKE